MCGIFGFYLKRPLNDEDIQLGSAGIRALLYRGPDNQGYWMKKEEGIFLGHARLSIIDVSVHSNQPMVRYNKVLSYSGEIYNFEEIKKELLNEGFLFTTKGDTEVLLQSWNKWGQDCLDRFDGMFAFAIYYDKKLHLVTDPFGEKPLYWAETKDGIYYSSEPGPLVKLLNLKPYFSIEDTTAFLCLGFVPSPHTGYAGLYRMPQGSHFIITSDGNIVKRKYWIIPKPVLYKGRIKPLTEDNLDAISGALTDSLRLRLRSDVPLGFFLSSGIDSPLITALAVKELGYKPLTLTVSFPDKEVSDEYFLARKIANFLKIENKKIDSREDPARDDPNILFNLFGEANDNITVAAVYQMSRQAALTVKVAITGMGGDEFFYGYNKYQAFFKWRYFLSLPKKVRGAVSLLISENILPKRLKYFGKIFSINGNCKVIAIKNIMVYSWLQGLPKIEDMSHSLFSEIDLPIELMGRYFDLSHTMPVTFIPAMERGSMRASIEVRTPFLNRRLLELLSSFDQRSFIAFGQKSALRRILKRYIPEELIDYPKKGFNYPVGVFLKANEHIEPKIYGLSNEDINAVWSKRNIPGWQKLALRIAILHHFQNQ